MNVKRTAGSEADIPRRSRSCVNMNQAACRPAWREENGGEWHPSVVKTVGWIKEKKMIPNKIPVPAGGL